MNIKAIETRYKGCRFRSRLEARWAVFFDAMNIRWEYEPQGFRIGSGLEPNEVGKEWNYLPDFLLVDLKTWVEVKGNLDDVSADYLNMLSWAIDWGGQLPNVSESFDSTNGLLWLSSIPSEEQCKAGAPMHPIIQHGKGGWVNAAIFIQPFQNPATSTFMLVNSGVHYFDSTWGQCDPEIRSAIKDYDGHSDNIMCCVPEIGAAYRAARSARFEFGESG